MKLRKIIMYIFLFSILSSFSMLSLGYITSPNSLVHAVYALDDRGIDSDYFLSYKKANKSPSFIRDYRKFCGITQEQVQILESNYKVKIKEFKIKNEKFKVLHILKPIEIRQLNQLIGNFKEDNCENQKHYKLFPIISPIIIS